MDFPVTREWIEGKNDPFSFRAVRSLEDGTICITELSTELIDLGGGVMGIRLADEEEIKSLCRILRRLVGEQDA